MKSQCAPLRCPWDHCSFPPIAYWALHWKPECFLSVFGIHCVLPGYSGWGEILAPLITMQLFLKEALIHVNDAPRTKQWWTSSCLMGSVWNCYECWNPAADCHTVLHLAYRLVKYVLFICLVLSVILLSCQCVIYVYTAYAVCRIFICTWAEQKHFFILAYTCV